jgi:hypothetical protein
MTKIRDMHGGRDYDPEWGKRMTGEGLWADLLQQRFKRATKARGFDEDAAPAHGPFRAAAARGRSAELF